MIFVVFAHHQPEHLRRLCRTLIEGDPTCQVVVHFDDSRGPHVSSLGLAAIEGVHVIARRQPVVWGDWSQVDGFLTALRWVRHHLDASWVVTLSGQCYPIKPVADIVRRLTSGDFDTVTADEEVYRPPEVVADPADERTGSTALHEYQLRYFFRYRALPAPLAKLTPAIEKLVGRSGTPRRLALYRNSRWPAPRLGVRTARHPYSDQWPCRKGAQWFAASPSALAHVLAYIDAHPDYVAWSQRTVIPDESFFVTIMENAAELTRSPDFVLHHVDWSDPTSYPRVFESYDFDALAGSEALFARKFDERSSALLDRIDEELLPR